MDKIKQALERMRKHTSKYPQILFVVMYLLIFAEATWFAECILKSRIDWVVNVNLLIHMLILFPIMFKFFGINVKGREIWIGFKSLFKFIFEKFYLYLGFFKKLF